MVTAALGVGLAEKGRQRSILARAGADDEAFDLAVCEATRINCHVGAGDLVLGFELAKQGAQVGLDGVGAAVRDLGRWDVDVADASGDSREEALEVALVDVPEAVGVGPVGTGSARKAANATGV